MGSPINPIVWLANKMAELDDYLKAGEIIISGSVVTPVRVQPGSNITFIRLGSVGATFVPRIPHSRNPVGLASRRDSPSRA